MTVKQLVKVLITVGTDVEEFIVIDENRNEHFFKDYISLDPYANKEVVSFSKNPYNNKSYEIMIARH